MSSGISQRRERPAFNVNQKEYELFFSLSQDMMCIAGTDGYFKQVNSSFERILGHKTAEFLARPFLDFIHPDDLENTKSELVKLSEGVPTVRFVNRYRCKDGSYRWLSWTSSSADSKGRLYAVAHDVTDYKLAETELRKNQNFLDSVVENIPDMIFIKDAKERKFVRFNKAGEELLGLSKEEMIGKSDYNFFPKKEADFFTKKDSEVLEGKKMLDIPEEEIKTKNKGIRYLHTRKIPLYDQEGRPEFLLGISEDITEAKLAEELIKENEQKLIEAQEIANVGSWEFDIETQRINWSNQTFRIFGIKPENKTFSLEEFREFIHPDDRELLSQKVDKALNKGIPYELEIRGVRKDGNLCYLLARGKPVKKKGKIKKLIGTVLDITEQKNEEVKIMRAVVEGQDMERRRIADDLHDSLGQKLSAMKLTFNSIDRELEKFSPRSKETYENLQLMLKDVVQELRNIAQNLMPGTLRDFGLEYAMRDLCNKLNCTDGVQVNFQSHGLKNKLSKNIETGVYRIGQELINNSLKHAKANELNVQLFERNNHLILTVDDDGVGFNMKRNDFENTFGFNSIMSRIKALKGFFYIESNPGQGTLASVEIPVLL